METITIVVKPCCVEVMDGVVKGARLKYWSDTLHIYVKGAVPVHKRDKVNYHAFEQARARHIPLKTLKSEGWV